MMISASKCRPLNSVGRSRHIARRVIRPPQQLRNPSNPAKAKSIDLCRDMLITPSEKPLLRPFT
jgi:hypothetical protein